MLADQHLGTPLAKLAILLVSMIQETEGDLPFLLIGYSRRTEPRTATPRDSLLIK